MAGKKIILSLILILIVVGCTATSKKAVDAADLRIGFKGLGMEFLKGTPPKKVFEGDLFPVMVRIRNDGAYSIMESNKAVLSLGLEKDYTNAIYFSSGGKAQNILDNAAEFYLDGKTAINPKGDEEIISYSVQAGRLDPQSEMHTSSIIATLCYPYETVLQATICIDTDPNSLRPGKKVCKSQSLVAGNGQGAPVAVAKIEINMLPLQSSPQAGSADKIKPQFLIYVENKGDGTVIKKESVGEFCTKSSTLHENLNVVYVDAFLSGIKLNCQLDAEDKPNERGHIKLKDKKDIIICNLGEGIDKAQDSYLSTLRVVLNYGYTNSISANYVMEKVSR